jgi:hypothetical protein
VVCGILVVTIIPLAIIQVVVVQAPWFVVLYGLRSYVLPFPVAFIMGESLNREDLHSFGRAILWLMIPTTLIAIAQYKATPNAWINAGANAGGQIGYIGDHVRASGTFSYVAGPMFFAPLAAAFLFYGLADAEFVRSRKLLWASAAAIVLSVPVTGSRTQVYILLAVVICVASASLSGVSQFGKMLKVIIPVVVLGGLVSFLPVFTESSKSLVDRFSSANLGEGGAQASFLGRTIMPTIETVVGSYDTDNWVGMGIGYGSNVAAVLTTGQVAFLAAEQEFPRVINEMGMFVGIGYMLFRYILAFALALKGFKRVSEQDTLCWLLVPVTSACLVVGVLEQPTETGFLVLTMAFSLAALKGPNLIRNSSTISKPI